MIYLVKLYNYGSLRLLSNQNPISSFFLTGKFCEIKDISQWKKCPRDKNSEGFNRYGILNIPGHLVFVLISLLISFWSVPCIYRGHLLPIIIWVLWHVTPEGTFCLQLATGGQNQVQIPNVGHFGNVREIYKRCTVHSILLFWIVILHR